MPPSLPLSGGKKCQKRIIIIIIIIIKVNK
jgi:hypothetical protein